MNNNKFYKIGVVVSVLLIGVIVACIVIAQKQDNKVAKAEDFPSVSSSTNVVENEVNVAEQTDFEEIAKVEENKNTENDSKNVTTKNNKIMAFVTIEDLYGSAEIIVFEPTYMKAQDILVEENIVIINGRLSIREDDATKIVANDIKNFEESKPNMLVLNITNLTEEQKAKLRGAIKFFNGEQNNIRVMVKINEELKPCGAIYLTDEILKVFEEIVGKENCQ